MRGIFLYLDLEELVQNEYLIQEDIDILKSEVSSVDYEYIKSQKESLLKKASQAFFCKNAEESEFKKFQSENQILVSKTTLFFYLK